MTGISFLELLKQPFLQNALIAGAIVGIITAIIGTFIILRRLSFIGAGISHSAFGGIALGILIGVDPFFSALIFCILTGFLIAFTSRNFNITEDSSVGIYFPAMMSLGIILLSFVKGYTPNLLSYLFGDILLVNKSDLFLAGISVMIIVSFISVFYRELIYITFDYEFSQIMGIPVKLFDYVFISLVSLVIVVSIKIVGIILVSALIVIPPITALKFSKNYLIFLLLSASIGIISTIGGIIISFYLNVPPGATIVLFTTSILFIALFYNKMKN
jgi:zinc transport system permease protein